MDLKYTHICFYTACKTIISTIIVVYKYNSGYVTTINNYIACFVIIFNSKQDTYFQKITKMTFAESQFSWILLKYEICSNNNNLTGN